SAGEGLTQNDGRSFSPERRNHYHVARRINVRRVPMITSHDDFVAKSCVIDCISHIDATLQNPGPLADYNEARIGTFLKNEGRRFDQLQLTFIRANHSHVADERDLIADADLTAKFCPVARRLELFQIDS